MCRARPTGPHALHRLLASLVARLPGFRRARARKGSSRLASGVLAPLALRRPLALLLVVLVAPAAARAQGGGLPGDGGAVGGTAPAAAGAGAATGPLRAEGESTGVPYAVHFVMDAATATADGGTLAGGASTVLGTLWPSNVGVFTPGIDASASKLHATPGFNVLVGDPDADGLFGEDHGGGLDALGVLRWPAAPAVATLPAFVLSTEDAWGSALPAWQADNLGALDGTLFSLRRTAEGSGLLVWHVLLETTITRALGQLPDDESLPDVDVDAFAQDEQGNVYLSFRHDELVGGVLLADDGVVCLPASQLAFAGDGTIVDAVFGSAVIVLDKPAVDALVQNVGLSTAAGMSIHTLGDLTALEIDPAGGRFTPVQPVPGLPDGVPHLLFAGQRVGATVLSTREGGSLARLNGRPLGSSVLSGLHLGLDAASTGEITDDLDGLLVLPRTDPVPCLDVEHREVDLAAGEHPAFLLGGFAPHGLAWVMVDAIVASPGKGITTVPVPGAGYPYLALPQPAGQGLLPLDACGRARLEIPLPAIGVPVWLLAQALDLASGRLGSPAAVWCP